MEKEKRFADFVFFFLMFLFFLRMRVSFFLIYVTDCAETYEKRHLKSVVKIIAYDEYVLSLFM